MRLDLRRTLSCSVAASAIVLAQAASAADFTIVDGQTVTTTQTLDTEGDVGTVEVGGVIDVPNANGIEATANGVIIDNAGNVTGTGVGSGIQALDSNTITNSGTAAGTGFDTYGIIAGDDNTITNSGTATGGFSGIYVEDGNTITNSGTATSESLGIYAGNDNTVTNSGTAEGGDAGIVAGDDNTITNSGAASGEYYGIYVNYNNTITNSGTATGELSGIHADNGNIIINSRAAIGGDYGIHALNDNTITNSGTASGGLSGIYAFDDNTITNSGSATGGDAGIVADDSNTITNAGTATGADSGISAGDNNTITNSGTASGGSSAIEAGNSNTITNSGAATGGTRGIRVEYVNTITNSGTATGGLYGIDAQDNNTIVNSGTATGGDRGIRAGDDNTITNSGAATGTAYGISTSSDNIIVNSGAVTGGVYGIWAFGNNTITNSGTIAGESAAVWFLGAGNTLRLLAGSNIQGDLVLGAGNTLSIGPGLNTALAYTGTPTIETGGLPTLVDGGVVHVVDPTGFSAAGEMVVDLTGIVAGALDQRLAAMRGGPAGVGGGVYGMAALGMFSTPAFEGADNLGPTAWITALGGYRDRGADGLDVGFDNLVGGLMAGADTAIDASWRGGLFLGAAAARMRTDPRSQSIDSGNYFAGGYASFTGAGAFLDLSLTAGVSDFSSDRSVANNMVPGGIEHAEADYLGFFVSPSVTLGRDFARDDGGVFTPSLRARYAGLFLDGYEESGSAADLSVDSRAVNVFELRGQLAYGFAPMLQDNGTLDATLRVGADGVFSDGGSIDATLLGNPLDFSAVGDSDETIRGFVGFDAAYATAGGASFTVGTELGYDSNDAFTARAVAGLQIPL